MSVGDGLGCFDRTFERTAIDVVYGMVLQEVRDSRSLVAPSGAERSVSLIALQHVGTLFVGRGGTMSQQIECCCFQWMISLQSRVRDVAGQSIANWRCRTSSIAVLTAAHMPLASAQPCPAISKAVP